MVLSGPNPVALPAVSTPIGFLVRRVLLVVLMSVDAMRGWLLLCGLDIVLRTILGLTQETTRTTSAVPVSIFVDDVIGVLISPLVVVHAMCLGFSAELSMKLRVVASVHRREVGDFDAPLASTLVMNIETLDALIRMLHSVQRPVHERLA